jgi:hypothetical protein
MPLSPIVQAVAAFDFDHREDADALARELPWAQASDIIAGPCPMCEAEGTPHTVYRLFVGGLAPIGYLESELLEQVKARGVGWYVGWGEVPDAHDAREAVAMTREHLERRS